MAHYENSPNLGFIRTVSKFLLNFLSQYRINFECLPIFFIKLGTILLLIIIIIISIIMLAVIAIIAIIVNRLDLELDLFR